MQDGFFSTPDRIRHLPEKIQWWTGIHNQSMKREGWTGDFPQRSSFGTVPAWRRGGDEKVGAHLPGRASTFSGGQAV